MSTMSGAFACEICNMVLNCHQQYQQHRAGKKHLAMAKSRGLSYSDNVRAEKLAEAKALSQGKPCSIDFVPSSSNQDNTFVGATSSGGNDPVKAAVVQNLLGKLPTKRKATVIGECEACGVVFNSTDQEAMHMNGKRHAKKMKTMIGADAGFYCSFCDIKLNSIEQLEQHRSGLKHQKKVSTAKTKQDEARLEAKLPKLTSEAPPLPGGIPPPPAVLEGIDTKN